jgi:sodium/proline symporter
MLMFRKFYNGADMITVFIIYLLILMGFAFWSRKETHTLSGYYLAGRKLPPYVVAFSTNATGESGWLLLGLTGMGYAVGAQAFWVVLGEVIGIGLAWLLVARRLKRISDQAEAITVPDVLVARFGDKWHLLRGLSVLIILSMVTAYVAAQMVAGGKAFGAFMDMEYTTAVLLGAGITMAYTFVGGYKAVAYTDLLQGVLMLLGLIIMPIVAINALGGWEPMTTQLAAIDPALLSPFGGADGGLGEWVLIVSFLAVGLPFLGVPQLMVRFMSARHEDEIAKAGVISVLVILAFDVGAVLTGMAGRALLPELADAETVLPELATTLFPPMISGVFMVIVLAAIMSTVDSLLLLDSSAVVRDFLQKMCGSQRPDRQLAGYGKIVTLVIGLLGVAFALQQSPMVFWFVLFAWSGLGAAFAPAILGMLFDKKMNHTGAVAGMFGGFVTTVVWVLWLKEGMLDLYEMIPGLLVGLLLAFVGSRVSGRTSEA